MVPVWKKSLRIKIGIIIVGVTTMILGLYTAQQYLNDRAAKIKELHSFAEVTSVRLANALSYSMFTYNKLQMTESVVSEMSEKKIAAIIVSRDTNKFFIGKKRDINWQPVDSNGEVKGNYIKIIQKIVYEKVELGTLELYISKKFINIELNKHLAKTVSASLATNIALLFAIFISLNTYIVRPVNRIAGFAISLKEGDLSQRLPESDDEIGSMSATLNSVVDELKRKANIASEISGGNLQQQINISSKQDLLGNALQEMVNHLNHIVCDLLYSAQQVDIGSHQVLSSSHALSESSSHQAASIQETVATMGEIENQTSMNAENAKQAHRLASLASSASDIGVNKMNEMMVSMQAISDDSLRISKIINTIDSIAFQTNLLALNAAVEAARAGKHGKGFAVVAQEVRNLAARSAKAAQDTAELIENSVKRVQGGGQIASKTADALSETNEGIFRMTDLVGDIAVASNEQAVGISQVNRSLDVIDHVTRENTAHAEETSAASEELSSQALHVRKILSGFRFSGNNEKQIASNMNAEKSPLL